MTPPRTPARRRQTIAATTIGNALEFFDFTVYGFLALVIGKLFFPTFDMDNWGWRVLSVVGGTAAGYVVTFYMPTYAIRELGMQPTAALLGAALVGLLSFALAPLFGGFSPFISTWLLNATGNKLAPAWYLLAMTLVSLLGLLWLQDLTGKDIDHAAAHRPVY